mmetsp:Transcript_4720/g.7177  ORF Transcript_4720/g.7177 Transcript_4720/m.7177 type:complete len:604 (+) Transcript_4720:176-1987(+)
MQPPFSEKKNWEDEILNNIECRKETNSSQDSIGTDSDAFMYPLSGYGRKYFLVLPSKLIISIYCAIKLRVVHFAFVAVALCLLLYARGEFSDNHSYLLGVSPRDWGEFTVVVFVIDICTAIADHLFLFLFESLWIGSYEVVYYMYSVHGPLGRLLTVAIIVNFFSGMKVLSTVSNIRPVVTTLIVLVILYTVKEYFIRKNYTRLLELRLKSRLTEIELWTNILSIIACRQSIHGEVGSDGEDSLGGETGEVVLSPMHVGGGRPERRPSGKALSVVNKVSDFFTDMAKQQDTGMDEVEIEEWEMEGDAAHSSGRTFWRRVRTLRTGSLKVTTCFGTIVMRRRKHAVSFGRQLYLHMTCGGTKVFSAAILCDLLRSACQSGVSPFLNHENIEEEVVKAALELFRFNDESNVEVITQAKVVAGIVRVFKEIKFAAASLHDLQNLHRSVLNIVDIIFWILMFLVAQAILKFDTSEMLAPLLTVLFGLSFAFGPVVANIFMSVAFVMLMLPFDVGNRVVIGRDQTTGIVGNIISICLMHTTILTRFNEKLRIPNHTLFHEKIINLNESNASTFEILVDFALDGPHAVSAVRICLYMHSCYLFEECFNT